MCKLLKFNTLLVAGITSILLVGFQNCSKYQYAAVDVADGSNNGLNTDTLPDNSSNDIDQVGEPGSGTVVGGGGSSTPVDGSGSGTTTPPVIGGGSGSTAPSGDGTTPPVIGGGSGSTTPSGDGTTPPVIGDDSKPPVIGGGGSQPPGGDNEECINEGKNCYVDDNNDEESDDNDLEAYCNKKYTSGKSSGKNRSAAAVEIMHRRGKMIITKDNIAHINLIEDFRGKLILCGVTVDKICNTRGSIVLVDTKVTDLSGHKGNLKIIGSSGSPSVSSSKAKINVDRSR